MQSFTESDFAILLSYIVSPRQVRGPLNIQNIDSIEVKYYFWKAKVTLEGADEGEIAIDCISEALTFTRLSVPHWEMLNKSGIKVSISESVVRK